MSIARLRVRQLAVVLTRDSGWTRTTSTDVGDALLYIGMNPDVVQRMQTHIDHYDSMFNTNVKGLLFTLQKALPLMPDGASIILSASVVASKGVPAGAVYSATKAAVRSFERTLTTDLKDRRIRVNAVSPGAIDTPGLNDLMASSDAAKERWMAISKSIPLGRLGTADEIAKAVVFLASDDSSYVTGTELFVDGGRAQV